MSVPQQPELARSQRSAVAPDAAKTKAKAAAKRRGKRVTAPPGSLPHVPEANQPGHHPERDQDKPVGPPPSPEPSSPEPAGPTAPRHFRFSFDPRLGSFFFGATPFTSGIDVADGELRVRFGPWSIKTPLDNVECVEETGPFSWFKVAGPPRISLADRGLAFATTTARGVCIRFREPVAAVVPFGILRHPAVTVTPDDPAGLCDALASSAESQRPADSR